MYILLTGGTGYIGSHTAVVLAEAGHHLVLYDNLSNSNASVAQYIKSLLSVTDEAIQFVKGDIRDTALLINTLQRYKIDAVIHFAGLKAVGESLEKPIEYYDNNIGGTISLLQAMRAVNIKTLVFSSSATVYGNPRYLPIDEDHPTSATNPYGRSKLHIEEMLSDVANSDENWRIACLRYFNPVGAHESGLIGENPNGIPNNLMPYITQVAIGKLPWLNIYGNDYPTPDGTGIRDYIHVMDLSEGHLASLNYLSSRESSLNIFNLGTGQGYSVLEMVNAFSDASGRDVPYKIVPRRHGDVAVCYAKVNKSAAQLQWKARRGLQEMCASSWKYQINNANMPALTEAAPKSVHH
ncbi:UDP-glucose 4-epimerase [Gammaproteobacteria bacterium]